MLTAMADELRDVLTRLAEHEETVVGLANAIGDAMESGGKLLTCGNGGSSAEAAHLAEEFTGRYYRERRSLPGICLSIDGTLMSCIANDYGYDDVFARQVEGLGAPGDVLVVFTSSGNSENIRRALVAAKGKGMVTGALLGKTGGVCKSCSDFEIIVPSQVTARVQEAHVVILHAICEIVERRVLNIVDDGE